MQHSFLYVMEHFGYFGKSFGGAGHKGFNVGDFVHDGFNVGCDEEFGIDEVTFVAYDNDGRW